MLQLTDSAVKQAKTLLQERGTPGHGLRVGVRGGGCSGYSYVLDYEERPEEDDQIMELDGLKVFIDPRSAEFLKDVTLDYEHHRLMSSFKFLNPHAKKSCGCGESFSI